MSKTPVTNTTTTSAKNNNNKIRRPMNCFLAFRLEKQNEIVARCPGANHRDISKVIAKWWKELPEEEKEPYRERARLAKVEHAKMYPDYKYRPQKRKDRKTRKYTRRPQNKFTSRIEKNNEMMELFYNNPRMLDTKSYSVALQEHHLQQQQQIMSPASPPLYTNSNSPASSSVTQDDLVLSPACYDDQQPMIVGSSSFFYQQSVAAAAMCYDWSMVPTRESCADMATTTTTNTNTTNHYITMDVPCVTHNNADPQMALVNGCIDPTLLTNTSNTPTVLSDSPTLSYPPIITVNDTDYFDGCYKPFHQANDNNAAYMPSPGDFEHGYNMQA